MPDQGSRGEAWRTLSNAKDIFNNFIGNRTTVIDIASHYPYSPERWRLFVDGTRKFPEYNSVSQYNHATDVHELTPSAGETVVFETAEKPRYVVQYELAATWAFRLNQSLQGNDKLIVGLYDGTDGWYMEHTASHSDTQADFVAERNGSVVQRESDIDIHKSVKTFARLKLQSPWYDIGRQLWERSFSENGEQRNIQIVKSSRDDGKGPQKANLPLHYEIQADASTTGLRLDAGSCAQVNLGKTTQFNREKISVFTDNIDTTGSWVPIRALRTDPDRDVVSVQFADLDIGEYSANDDVELLAIAFADSNVLDTNGNELTDSDYAVPNDLSDTSSVIQSSSAVEQVADSTGSTSTSVSDPGGWQVRRAELFTGKGKSVASPTSTRGVSKNTFYNRDTIVILGKTGTTGDITYQLQFQEDW